MKSDNRLKSLCEEFTGLDETEKDYILGVSQALTLSVFENDTTLIHPAGIFKTDKNSNFNVLYKEYLI